MLKLQIKKKNFHCRKSLFFYKNEPWKKKDSDSCFHFKMESYGDAELYKFVVIYLVIKIFKEIGFKIDIETNLKIANFLDMTFN